MDKCQTYTCVGELVHDKRYLLILPWDPDELGGYITYLCRNKDVAACGVSRIGRLQHFWARKPQGARGGGGVGDRHEAIFRNPRPARH